MKNFWRRAFDFAGRSSRREYRIGILCSVLLAIPGLSVIITGAMLHNDRVLFAGIALHLLICVLFWFVPFIALCVRRKHDLGKSGWGVLFDGWWGNHDLWWQPSEPTENRYGPPPADADPAKR